MREENTFTEYYQFESSGGLIGLNSCKVCGAAILLERPEMAKDNFDSIKTHVQWHESLAAKEDK